VEKTLGHLKEHVVICGFGRNGSRATEEFKAHRVNFVVIESDDNVINEICEKQEILFVYRYATRNEVLKKVRI